MLLERCKNVSHKRIIALTYLIFSALVLISLVCYSSNLSDKVAYKHSQPIKIGSKDFTENLIVSELYALSLEENGYQVKRVQNLSSSLIHTALIKGEINMYPEYTGTGLLSILKEKIETNPDKVYEKVKEGYAKHFHVTWLPYSSANDGQGLVIRTDLAKKYKIYTISDLQKHAGKLRFASQGEFDKREDGLAGLKKVYGEFNWSSSTIYDNSLKYRILESNQADVTPAYTTEGQLVKTEMFTLLRDDKLFWPPYNLAPIVSDKTLQQYPNLEKALKKVTEALDTKTMTRLNAQVDVEGKDYKKVAKEFYTRLSLEGKTNGKNN